MGTLRRQGVYGEDAATKKSKNVQPADFLIGGLIGFFERKYTKTFRVRNDIQLKEIFGANIISTYYGWDGAQGFFDCSVGAEASLFVKAHVGNSAGVIDAVVATADLDDQAGPAVSTLQLDAAYQEVLEYGISGKRTGYTITNGTRFATETAAANLLSDTFIDCDSVAGIKVGDIISCVATGGGGATVEKKVTGIDQAAGRVSFSGAFDGAANMEIGDTVDVLGFQLKTWRKSTTGIVDEVNTELGKIWCTMEPEVGDFYVQNVFSTSTWMKATDLASASLLGESFPADVTTVAYLLLGADGTAPTVVADWNDDLVAFANDPIRMICNVETTATDIQKAIETKMRARSDKPKVLYNIAELRSKAQLITIGNNFQRSDDVLGVIVSNWLEKTDPFVESTLAPKRHIPSCGHVMGAWMRSIKFHGAHWIPAVATLPLLGITGIAGSTPGDTTYQYLDDLDRTDLANAGINVIQFVKGSGIVIKSFFTPSTSTEFRYGNGILMREYIKISIVDSLANTENEPNTFARIESSRVAAVNFMNSLWRVGSNGEAPEGEFFGQTIDPTTGESSVRSDHFQVQADIINNPQASIDNGERNIDIWFTFPSPAGSIRIKVGMMLLG